MDRMVQSNKITACIVYQCSLEFKIETVFTTVFENCSVDL